jgi:hypothetical protein
VDLLLLLAQVVLIVLLVVLPLFSAFDKWQAWSTRRKVIALALALGIAVVAFGQYRRIVHLHEGDLRQAVGNVGLFHGAWYARRISFSLWEYLGSLIAGSALLGLTVDAARRKSWAQTATYSGVFALMIGLVMLLKMRSWAGD